MPDGGSIPDKSDFDLGPIRVRPAVRTLETASASVGVEPIVMQLLVTLSRRAGKLVTRQQAFDACWGSAAVGDDSLNRAVAVLRKAGHGAVKQREADGHVDDVRLESRERCGNAIQGAWQ